MKYIIAAKSETGLKKKCNQDSVSMKRAVFRGEEICLALICDGMGGLSKGEFASKSIADAFSDWFIYQYSKYEDIWNVERICDDLKKIVASENDGLIHYGKRHGIKLGTTLTAVLAAGENYLVCHVGDTRLYRITGAGIEQMTKDHTVIEREIANGSLTREQAKNDPRRNILLQCIGAIDSVIPDIFTGKAAKGDILLLCSDGFRHEVSESEIFNVIMQNNSLSYEEKLESLIELNLERNEQDNISAALVKLY